MISYRFRRRSFIAAAGGGVGLKIMLRNLESSAQGLGSPPRLLVTHWPVGIVAGSGDALWKPTSGSVGGSPALKPFADLGLGSDMTVLRGLTTGHLPGPGGGHEGGTVRLVTGVSPPGTRTGQSESDDSFAGGPSFDQILLEKVPALRSPGSNFAYLNAIADSRTDHGEISTKTLSYSTSFQVVAAVGGTVGREAIPLRSVISPLDVYNNLFRGFIPGTGGSGGSGGSIGGAGGGGGGGTPQPVADAMLRRLVARRSVLDFSLRELEAVKRMAPSGARNKLQIHTDAVLAAETSVVNAINTSYPNQGGAGGGGSSGSPTGGGGGGGSPTCGTCTTAPPPPPDIRGMADPMKGFGFYFNDPRAQQDDAPHHAAVGAAHLAVLKAAFICDLIRVGTYQWSPGTNHVGFALFPGTTEPYQHHPQSHRITTADTTVAAELSQLNATAQFLFNVQLWYFARHAENLAAWKNAVDGCGNSLLDFTCVPFLTEVRSVGHERTNMPGMIIGGKQLGFQHGRYVPEAITINRLWGTIAQAFGHASPEAPFDTPVPGFWTKPPTP